MIAEAPLYEKLNLLGLPPESEAFVKALWHRVRQIEELLEPLSDQKTHKRLINYLRMVLAVTMLTLRNQVVDDDNDLDSFIPVVSELCHPE